MANYYRALGVGLAAIPRAPLVVWYPPAARRYKPLVRAVQQALGCACELGDAAQAQSATSYAALGAKAGSIVPGIGNVVGAVVGLVVGAMLGKKKPVRPTGQQVANCRTLLTEYNDAVARSPDLPLPLDLSALKDLNWCMMAVYGNDVRLKDPRFFDGNYNDLLAIARNMVRAIFTTPVGGTVNIAETVNKIGKQTFRSSGLTFSNPPFTNLKAFARDTFQPVAVAYCQQTAGKGSGGCATLYSRPELTRWFFDLLGYVAATELPQIRFEDLNRPEPTPATPAPSSPTTTVPVPAGSLPPNVAPPALTAPSLPPNATPDQIQAAISQLTTMFMQTQQAQALSQQQAAAAAAAAAQQWLASQGVRAPAAAVDATTRSTVMQAGAGGTLPLLLGLAGALFLLARPGPRLVYRRSARRRR